MLTLTERRNQSSTSMEHGMLRPCPEGDEALMHILWRHRSE